MNALSCPSCGAPHTPANPGIVLIACDACGTTLYREGDLLRAGREARLAEPLSALRVGATGRIGGRSVTLLGRIGFSWGEGRWDEWYAVDTAGREGWIVEDGRRYTWETSIDAPDGVDNLSALGDAMQVDGARFEVRELGTAVCEGAEGQLPRPILPGETYGYVDLDEVQGARRLLVERDPEDGAEAFLGERVDASEVVFQRSEAMAGADRAPEARAVRCPQCGAPAEVPVQGEPVRTLACGYCEAVFEPAGEVGTLLGQRGETPSYLLEVGDRGTLDGVTWETVGRMLHVEPDGWRTQEFLLWCADHGYRWLEYSDGHTLLLEPAVQTPSMAEVAGLHPKWPITIDGVRYRMVEGGTSRLRHVDGALPWAARLGDETRYIDLIAPPKVASVSGTADEVEFFVGTWRPGAEVAEAFGRSDRLDRPAHRHPAEPNGWRPWLGVALAAVLFAILNCGIAGALSRDGQEVFSGELLVDEAATANGQTIYEAEPELSDAFTLDPGLGPASHVDLSADVDNSWVWTSLTLVPADVPESGEVEAAGFLSEEVGYYHGRSGGESWSEGSRSREQWFRTPEAGRYRLLLSGEADRPTRVRYTVYTGAAGAGWAPGVLFLLLGIAALIGFGWMGREGGRFPSDEDED